MIEAVEIPPSQSVATTAAITDESVLVRRTTATEIDVHTQHLGEWSLQYDQLDCGSFQGSFTEIRWPGMQLFVETMSRRVRQRGRLQADSFGLGTLFSGDGDLLVDGRRTGQDSLMSVHSTDIDFCSPANCTFAGFVLERSRVLEATGFAPEVARKLESSVTVTANSPDAAMSPLRTLLQSVIEMALTRPSMLQEGSVRQQIRDDLLLLSLDAIEGAEVSEKLTRIDARKAVVDRACDLMLAQQDEPMTLLDVCNRLQTSPRKLGYCFQDILGLSPARYIKAVRLNAVRRELRSASGSDTSVYDVAARWGFWHFGHFSADYKRQFAELPSQTLRNARA